MCIPSFKSPCKKKKKRTLFTPNCKVLVFDNSNVDEKMNYNNLATREYVFM